MISQKILLKLGVKLNSQKTFLKWIKIDLKRPKP